MRKFLAASVSALSAMALSIGMSASAGAAPLLFNFTPTANGVTDLGNTETYTVSGVSVTAWSGSYSGTTVTRTGLLLGNNRGADEQGLGVCLGATYGSGPCAGRNISNDPEIDYGSELVQLDITSLLAAGYTNLMVNADSGTQGERLAILSSKTSTGLGTLLTTISSASGDVAISQNGNFLNFVSANNLGGGDVLLHSLSADKTVIPAPEPASLALLGAGLFGLGAIRRRTSAGSAR